MLSEVVYNHHQCLVGSPTASLSINSSSVVSSPSSSTSPSSSSSSSSSSESASTSSIPHHLHHLHQLHHHFTATSCSAAAAAALLMASSNQSNNAVSSPMETQQHQPAVTTHHHSPALGATGQSISLPVTAAPPKIPLSTVSSLSGSNNNNSTTIGQTAPTAAANAAAPSTGAMLMSLGQPKRSKLRPRLSLRIALSSSQQVSGSSPMSPSGFLTNPGCSFDGCLPLSPTIQQHLHQKSEPLLSASAIDELQPVEILPKLYVGTMKSASDRTLLERLNIGYIINVTTNLPNFFEERYPNNFKYLRIPLEDHWSGEISSYIDEAISFINMARRSDRACLVHCLAGRSRSVAIVLAYIMYTFACTLDDAYDLVKSRKPGVAPGLHFLRQLHDFEKRFVPANNNSAAGGSPCGSSGGAGSEESSGCSTPSTSMSLSSFDPADMSSPVPSVSGGGGISLGSVPIGAVPSSTTTGSSTVTTHLRGSNRFRDRTICPSLPSVDSAFTDDQTPPAPTSSHSFTVFSADDTMKD